MKKQQQLDHRAFAEALIAWFELAQRDLPWRNRSGTDAYAVLVSEMMLQQTVVAAAIGHYMRFMDRFPNMAALAAAPVDEVLAVWQGLGYYSRARNLHACARQVVERHGGVLPRDVAELMALPGIGRYTAGAVASIAYNEPVAIVEANVARVLARVLAISEPVSSSGAQRVLWQEAANLVEAGYPPRTVNPALMELGALICRPRLPDCARCPVAAHCSALRLDLVDQLPVAQPRPDVVPLHHVCVLVRRPLELRLLLRQRPDQRSRGNWWRGMWELPWTAVQPDEEPSDTARRLCSDIGVEPDELSHLKTLRHTVTHHRIKLECWQIDAASPPEQAVGAWLTAAETEALPMPSPMRKLVSRL